MIAGDPNPRLEVPALRDHGRPRTCGCASGASSYYPSPSGTVADSCTNFTLGFAAL
jgi:hypothetical protein